MLRATVVIPTFNRSRDLEVCLAALAGQSLPYSDFEVIVVDDGSIDRTAEVVRKFQTSSRLNLQCERQCNRGPATARNLGIEHARADLIAFTDDDCLPGSKWLEELLEALPNDPRCAGVGGAITRLHDGLIGRFIDRVGMLAHQTSAGQVQYLVTANALFRKDALQQVGGFERRFTWAGGEDPDLGDRLRALGYTMARTVKAVVRHKHRDSLLGLFNTYRRYGRGEAARVRLGRKSGIWYRSKWIFFIGCVGHWVVHAPQLLLAKGIRMRDRLCFPILNVVANAGVFVGYTSGPGLAEK